MSTEKTVPVATYLFQRLHQLGIRSVHGVPGDFNLVALDYIPTAGLNWVGNCNELNAAYAADGYAVCTFFAGYRLSEGAKLSHYLN